MDDVVTKRMNPTRLYPLLMILALIGVAHAQSPTGTIAGVVTDRNAGHLAGAHVTITDRNTGLTRKILTSTEGEFSAPALPADDYLVTVEAEGFKTAEHIDIVVLAGTTTTVKLELEVGKVI